MKNIFLKFFLGKTLVMIKIFLRIFELLCVFILHIILTFLKSIEIMRKNIAKMQKLCKKKCA